MDYSWDSFTFTGDPLKTILGDIIDANADVAQSLADILRLQAEIMDFIASISTDIENPFAAISEVLLRLLQNLLDILIGRIHVIFVHPMSMDDKFGVMGFSSRIQASLDDSYDALRPQFPDYKRSTISGADATVNRDSVDFTEWTGLIDDVYYKVAPSSVDFSSLNGVYIVIAGKNGTFEIIEQQLNFLSIQIPSFLALPTPEDIAEQAISLSVDLAEVSYPNWSGAPVLFVIATNGVITFSQDVRVTTPSLSMLVLYWNDASMLDLYNQVQGLSLFFQDNIDSFKNLADYSSTYIPRELTLLSDQRLADYISSNALNIEPIQMTASQMASALRPRGVPPDWISPSPAVMLNKMMEPLKQMFSVFSPEPSQTDFLSLMASTLNGQADFLQGIANGLMSIAYYLDNSTYTAARLWVPMTYGGNSLIKDILNATIFQLTEQGGYTEDTYSFGAVMVAGAESHLTLKMMAGLDPFDANGQPDTITPNIVTISGREVTVVTP